jgi:hypothetical protein
MVDLAQLVNESLVRHGVETNFDPRRVQWSKWFRIEDSFSVLLVPAKPGLFALAEEVAAFGGAFEAGVKPQQGDGSAAGRRMLALFEVSQTDDLGMSLGRLFLPGGLQRERLETGKCFVRYAVVDDAQQRQSAYAAFQAWLSGSAEAASGIAGVAPNLSIAEASPASGSSNNKARNGPPEAFFLGS